MTEFIFTRWLFVASLVLFSIGAEERSCQNVGMLVNQWLKGGQAESENLVLKEFTKIRESAIATRHAPFRSISYLDFEGGQFI